MHYQFQMKQEEHCFVNDYQYFKNIPKQERAAFNRKLLEVPQQKGEYKVYKMEYPTSGTWLYRGHELFYSSYKNSQNMKPNAVVFSFHGLNDHGGSSGYMWINIAKALGLDVYALDFMNFGRSKGPYRGQVQSLEDMVNQAEKFIEQILYQYSQKNKERIKIFIEGFSLGGAVSFSLSIRNPSRYDGVIMLSPGLKENTEAQPYLKKIGRLVGRFFPHVQFTSNACENQTRINQAERINKDPYVFKDKVVAISLKVLLQSLQELPKSFQKFERPFIIIQAGIDKFVDPFAALELEEKCSSKDKTIIYCKNMWHDIHAEEQIQDLMPILTNWMRNRI